MMIEIQVQLSLVWAVLMVIYCVGSLLRIFSIDSVESYSQTTWFRQPIQLSISMLTAIPILMLVLILMLPHTVSRRVNIALAGFILLINWMGLPRDLDTYDKFLIAVGVILNIVTLWLTWNLAII